MKNAPGTRSEHAGAKAFTRCKDTQKFGYHQTRVMNLLRTGGMYSAADISIALRLSDPRSTIRDLRAKGVPIADVWCDSEHGGRFKRYFIHTDSSRKEVRDEQ